jgi:hypothetical protein
MASTAFTDYLARTPFLSLFAGLADWGYDANSNTANKVLQIWLEDLEACGVDLLEYGRTEKAIFDGLPYEDKDFALASLTWVLIEVVDASYVWHLIDFTFGPLRSDWVIYGSEPTDQFAGDFWSMVDPPEMLMPGMWIE